MQAAIAILSGVAELHATSEVHLVPAGEFRGRDGRPTNAQSWKLPNARGRALAARLTQHHASIRFNFDYEHQAMLAEKNGQPAPAAGWATKFAWRDDQGLFAVDVQWTERARQMIESGEYAYLSPVISYDKKTGEVLSVINAALTNIPALDLSPLARERIEQLSAAHVAAFDEESTMQLTEIERAVCSATGIPEADYISTRDAATRHKAAQSDLSEAELAVCRATGIEPAQFAASRAALRA